MTKLSYDCGCVIDFVSYGVTEADLCSYHSDKLRQIEQETRDQRLVEFYKTHPEGNHSGFWTYTGNDPEIIRQCQEERAKYA